MRKYLFLTLTVFAVQAFAASVTITSNQASENPELVELPQKLIGLLGDYGRPLTAIGNGVYKTDLMNLKCTIKANTALDQSNPLAGVPSQTCTAYGQTVQWGTTLTAMLTKIEAASVGRVSFSDCAAGTCNTELQEMSCTVDTKVETAAAGRFACTLTDMN